VVIGTLKKGFHGDGVFRTFHAVVLNRSRNLVDAIVNAYRGKDVIKIWLEALVLVGSAI
jgi:hypothetical protein